MTNKNQTTPESDSGQPLDANPTSEQTGDTSSYNLMEDALDSTYWPKKRKHIDPDNGKSLDSSPPRLVNRQTTMKPTSRQMFHGKLFKNNASIYDLKNFKYGVKRTSQLLDIWEMIYPVLPQGIPCYLPNIYAAMLRRFKIPFKKWEKSVKNILVSESRRSDSPIKQHNEASFIVDVNLKSWLPTHENYSPDFESIVNQEIDEIVKNIPFAYSNRAASAEDALSLGDHGDILDDPLAKFKLEVPAVPPGMSPEKTELLKDDIYLMDVPEMRSEVIAKILQLPKLDSLRYGRELWKMALYDEVLLKPVFETFCELANQSPTWAEIVLDAIFCVELQPQDETAPFNDILLHAGISCAPNVSKVRVAGFLYLLKYMNQSPDNWKNVIKWLLEKHTYQFKSLFVGILINVGRHNEHLQGAVRHILNDLMHCDSWGSMMFTRGAHGVN